MIRTNRTAILASALAVLMTANPALAGRGGFGGGGGFRGGGGGGFRGGSFGGGGGFRGGDFGGGGFRGGDFGGGGFRGGDFGGDGFRGGNFDGSSFNRTPSFDAGRFNNFNSGANIGNRGAFSNDASRFGVGNRTGIGNTVNGGNRFSNDGNRVNNGNFDGIRAGNTNIGNRVGNTNVNVNNVNAGRINNVGNGNRGVNDFHNGSYGYGNWHNSAYNRGWVHGYWNGWNAGAWNNAGWFGLGAGLGWGLSAWSYGPWLYNWGYSGYANPYYGVPQPIVVNQPIAVQTPIYDYSQPINSAAAPPAQTDNDAATALFDQGRAAFLKGNYPGALGLADRALAKIPNDSALHEFRALCQFALGQYDNAAAALFAVLSVGPGWDWTTLISLYPSVDDYTAQLRALETYVRAHEDSASAHFVLGYHYMTENFAAQAAQQFAQVAKLKPSDTLSAQLADHLTKAANPDAAAAPATSIAAPVAASPMPTGASLAGQWAASPAAGTTIALAIAADNTFTWTVKGRGGNHTMKGTAAYEGGLLTLAQNEGPPLVGRVSWADATHITFRVDGGPVNDPGLTLAKS